MNILDKYSIRRKLIIMVAVLCVPSTLLLYQTVMLQNRTIVTTELELQGVEYARGLEVAAGPIADHRGLADLYLNGNKSRAPAMADSAKQIDSALQSLSQLEAQVDPHLQNGAKWHEVVDEWDALKRDLMNLSPQESERRHTSLLDKLRVLNTLIVDRSTLILDPEETSHYLMDASVLQIPRLQRDVFDLRGSLSSVVGLSSLPNAMRIDLSAKVDRVNRNAEILSASVDKLALLVPEAAKGMKEAAAQHLDAALAFAGTIQDGLLLSDHPQNINSTAFALGTQAYELAAQLHGVLMPSLQKKLEQRLQTARLERNVSLFGGLTMVLFAIMLARMTRVHITGGALRVVKTIERIANGEIGRQESVYSSDEFGQVLNAVNRLDGKLVEVVAAMRTTADTVGAAAHELTDGNDHLSGRTHQQAASIQQTAASMEEMTATVKQNADNAQQADHLVAGVHRQAERGGVVVHRAVGAMDEINDSSRKIADIIGVIDAIAFQTNLLALNAAVEAARAGEQGRGFAVVASEVRVLAQRSASAAQEIKTLINDSVEKVRSGAELVNESGTTLAEIMVSIKKASDVMADIAAASQQQSTGIEQVNMSVAQMDASTQENSSLVEESKALSKKIQTTVQRLVTEVAFFKVHGREISPVASPPNRSARRTVEPTPIPAKAKPAAEPVKPRVPRMAAASGDGVMWKEF